MFLKPGSFLPQALCTSCASCLDLYIPGSPRSQLRCLLVSEAALTTQPKEPPVSMTLSYFIFIIVLPEHSILLFLLVYLLVAYFPTRAGICLFP